MKCIEVRGNLDEFADGEMDFSKRKNIELHLLDCPNCKAEQEAFQTISHSIKRTLPIPAPSVLDAKVMNAFKNHHTTKQIVDTEEKIGWFGIPKLAFATAFLLFTFFSVFTFQLGRMSVGNIENVTSTQIENYQKIGTETELTNVSKNSTNDENETQKIVTKIVEVPVIKEKIIKIPVIKEKIITKTIYVNDKYKNRPKRSADVSTKSDFAINNSVKDGEVLTQTNLKGFEPVAVIKPKITKQEK